MSITEIYEAHAIMEIKGTCPQCGGPLEIKPQVCAWNPDGSPSEEDTHDTIYCPTCKLFWHAEEEG